MKDGQQDEGQDDRHGQGAEAAKTAGEEEKHLGRLLRYCPNSRGCMAPGRTTCPPSAIGNGSPRALLTETCLIPSTMPPEQVESFGQQVIPGRADRPIDGR